MSIYYVSSTGNDSNSGLTTALAWQTLTKVNSRTFVAGDQILFKRGDSWYGTLTILQWGTVGNPITFGAYGTGINPTISGFTTVTAWTNLGSNIWESTSAVSTLSTCNMVAINGVSTAMGRWPNADTSNSGYAVIATNPSTTSITSASLTGTPNWTGAELVLREHYLISRTNITSQVGNLLNYETVNTVPIGSGFFIENHPSTLDQQNEWYFNPITKKIQVYSTSQPTDVKVSSQVSNISITGITAMSYIDIDGLTLEGSNNNSIRKSGPGGVGNYINVRNCTARFNGVNGLEVCSHYATFENNTVTDSHVNGIVISSCEHVTIRNNVVNNVGMLRGMGDDYMGSNAGITATYAHYLLCEKNSVTNTSYKGIGFYGNYITIKNNYINTFGVWQDDGGAIYTYTGGGTPIVDCVIDGNVILNGMYPKDGTTNEEFPIMSCGIYLDDHTEDVEILNNSIYNVSSYAIMMNAPANINVHHNTIFDSFDVGSTTTNTLVRVNNRSDLPVQGYNIDFSYNIFATPSGNVYPIYLSCVQSNLNLIGSWDNNYYVTLSSFVDNFFIHQPSTYGDPYITLAQWQTFSSQDANSSLSPKTINNGSELTFIYNETATSRVVTAPFEGIDVEGNQYTTSVLLQPYTSKVLIQNAGTPDYPTVVSASVSPSSVNTSGQVTFTATASEGTIKWWTSSIGGTEVTVLNPIISSSTTYYAEAISTLGYASLTRTAVTAVVLITGRNAFRVSGNPWCVNGKNWVQ